MTFHYRLIELESELKAKEQSLKGFEEIPVECLAIGTYIEQEIGIRLADQVPLDWQGWLTYKRKDNSLVVCRGKAFKANAATKPQAGLDVSYGLNSISEYKRHFDISPPQDLDHLLINFGGGQETKVFLWYGENLAAYKLIYEANVTDDPHNELYEAVVEACIWIIKRPKDITLAQFLKEKASN